MGADQQFCLRWNNFHTNITSAFESLRDDEDFVDITLACEGRQIKAHRMVLSACSPYFRSLLRGNPCKHPIVFLKDVSFANLASILDFMYHGEVNVSHHELATFLKTAEALRVRGLAEDDKKKDGDTCTESSSPPPREITEPCSPGRPEEPPDGGGGVNNRSSAGDSMPSNLRSSDPSGHLDGPPSKRQRRRSGADPVTSDQTGGTPSVPPDMIGSQQHTADGVRDPVKNEPEEYINDDDDGSQNQQQSQQSLSNQSVQQQLTSEDIKLDSFNSSSVGQDDSADYNMPSESISNRNQAAMQQLQDTFSSFIPNMTAQGSGGGGGFIPHSTSEHSSRSHPPFSIEGVQGLPPGISAIPGSSLTQGGSSSSSQDTTGQGTYIPPVHCATSTASPSPGHHPHYPSTPCFRSPGPHILSPNYSNEQTSQMMQHSPYMAQHSPHMAQNSPHIAQHSPHATHQSPHATQQSPHMSQQYPPNSPFSDQKESQYNQPMSHLQMTSQFSGNSCLYNPYSNYSDKATPYPTHKQTFKSSDESYPRQHSSPKPTPHLPIPLKSSSPSTASGELFPCDICGKLYKNKNSRSAHRSTYHREYSRRLASQTTNLQQHQLVRPFGATRPMKSPASMVPQSPSANSVDSTTYTPGGNYYGDSPSSSNRSTPILNPTSLVVTTIKQETPQPLSDIFEDIVPFDGRPHPHQ